MVRGSGRGISEETTPLPTWPDGLGGTDEEAVDEAIPDSPVKPWSFSDYENRLRTFSSLDWPLKETAKLWPPPKIARYGWEVSAELRLKCSFCHKIIICENYPARGGDQVVLVINAIIMDGHYEFCPWTDNPSPSSFASALAPLSDSPSTSIFPLTPQSQARLMVAQHAYSMLAEMPLRCLPKLDTSTSPMAAVFVKRYHADLIQIHSVLPDLSALLQTIPPVLACFEHNALPQFRECAITALCMATFGWESAASHIASVGFTSSQRQLSIICRCCQSVNLLKGLTSAMISSSLQSFSQSRSLSRGNLLFGQRVDTGFTSDSAASFLTIDSSSGIFLVGDRKKVHSPIDLAIPHPISSHHLQTPTLNETLFDPYASHRHFCAWKRFVSNFEDPNSLYAADTTELLVCRDS